ncbi:MAG TPA: DUF4364 family protein [Clostridia bacterium]|nr:DUF4364 family protein [Clostridia bacterium]HRU84823.1 DUF4364 family protein [Eubacteriales bacterium]
MDNTIKKLVLLYVFDSIAMPLAEDTLIKLTTSDNEWLSFIDCKQSLIELLETELIYQNKSGDRVLYSITADGRECLAHFYTRIPSSLREEITRYTRDNRLRYRKKQEYFSDYSRNPDGSYTVILKITDSGSVIMELKLIVPSRATASRIYNNWVNKAAQVYGQLYESIIN